MLGQKELIQIEYLISPVISNEALNALFSQSWPTHDWRDFTLVHQHSLAYLVAYATETVVGYINVAWDGSIHGFLLNPTVHPDWRRMGIGGSLVQKAAQVAKERGIYWLHVDYEPHHKEFYNKCGFRPTLAGVMPLQ